MKKVALYLRVSTVGHGQTTKNQRRELETAAKRNGWSVAQIFEDTVSGGSGRDKRPGLDALLRGVARKDFDMVGRAVSRVSHG
jgi:DNA invertase Pin-like site-specific DNA recombinase